jgi:hypoxanthine phosphoribosyltransferase
MKTIFIPDNQKLRPVNNYLKKTYGSESFLGTLITHEEIEQQIATLAQDLKNDYAAHQMIILWLADGASMFAHDLSRALSNLDVSYDLIGTKISSYDKTKSSGKLNFHDNHYLQAKDKHVVLLDDINDTGLTRKSISSLLVNDIGVASLKTCYLADKRLPGKDDKLDYVLFSIPEAFIVGYNLDLNGHFREPRFRDICVFNEKMIDKYCPKT